MSRIIFNQRGSANSKRKKRAEFHFLIRVPKSETLASLLAAMFLSQAGLAFGFSKSFHASIFGCRSASENALNIRAKNNHPQKQPAARGEKGSQVFQRAFDFFASR